MARALKSVKSAAKTGVDVSPASDKPRAKAPDKAKSKTRAKADFEATAKSMAKSASKAEHKPSAAVPAASLETPHPDVPKAATPTSGEPKKSKKLRLKKKQPHPRIEAAPDFICVGLQKGGTRWLYDQLQHHEDFWMPASKEIHYFDRKFPDFGLKNMAQKFAKNPHRIRRNRQMRGHSPIDDRNEDFYRQVLDFSYPEGDLEAYASLFRMKGDKITGDITPAYCNLDSWTIGQIAKRFDKLKVCLLLREPASRLWSQWRMHLEKKPHRAGTSENDLTAFREFLQLPGVLARSYPTKIAERWRGPFGERFRAFFLDDIVSRPDEVRLEMLGFLGGDPSKPSDVNPDFNRKAKTPSALRSPEIQELMRELFEPERAKCAKMFGGPAEKWLTMPY